MLEERVARRSPESGARSRDLESRSEIHELVVDFYREVVFDEVLGPVFDQVARVDWSVHIPKLTDYWCRVLLGEQGYEGRILGPHQRVHGLEPFRQEMFDRWYNLFVQSVDLRWRGPIADRAKAHAATMAGNLARRLIDLKWQPEAADA